jgi:hypothetical protein
MGVAIGATHLLQWALQLVRRCNWCHPPFAGMFTGLGRMRDLGSRKVGDMM